MAERTVTEHAPPSVRPRDKPLPRLGVIVVHSRGSSESRVLEVPDRLSVGRDPDAGLFVDEAGASRDHARLEQRQSALLVTDLGSRNGTFVDGERIGSEGTLAPAGTVIRVGRTLLVVANVAPYAVERPAELPGLLGGAALDEARFRIDTIASTRSPVLVLGETGTGKEVVGRLVHDRSGRSGPFVALNCAAVPSELVDAELFGHSRGAFSGAASARVGQFRSAHGGTLLLDEIGEMPAAVQAKLLRALETGEVRPVGEDQAVTVDVRVVAATNRELDELLESGAFRADLLHRLAGLRIKLPPLRERREDVPILAEHFAGPSRMPVAALALERLMVHRWPGNVRELRNVIHSAVPTARQKGHVEIEVDDVASLLAHAVEQAAPPPEPTEVERIEAALALAAGDVAAAAKELGMSRSVLYEALRRLGINPRVYRRR